MKNHTAQNVHLGKRRFAGLCASALLGSAAAAPVPWSIDGDLLTYQIIEPSETHTVVTPIAIADGHLLLAAMDAQGAVDALFPCP